RLEIINYALRRGGPRVQAAALATLRQFPHQLTGEQKTQLIEWLLGKPSPLGIEDPEERVRSASIETLMTFIPDLNDDQLSRFLGALLDRARMIGLGNQFTLNESIRALS